MLRTIMWVPWSYLPLLGGHGRRVVDAPLSPATLRPPRTPTAREGLGDWKPGAALPLAEQPIYALYNVTEANRQTEQFRAVVSMCSSIQRARIIHQADLWITWVTGTRL